MLWVLVKVVGCLVGVALLGSVFVAGVGWLLLNFGRRASQRDFDF